MDCYRFCFTAGFRTDGDGAILESAYVGRSRGLRSQELSGGTRFFGAGQRCAGGRWLGTHELFASRGHAVANESSDRQQHHGTAASAIGYRSDYRRRDTLALESKRVGECSGAAVLLGTLRFWIWWSKGEPGTCRPESNNCVRFCDTS